MNEPVSTAAQDPPTTASGGEPSLTPKPPSGNPESHRISGGEKFLFVTSLALFTVIVLLQTWGAGVGGALAGLWLLASYSLLKSGGLALTDGSFGLAMMVGAGVAALSLVGSVARAIYASRRRGKERQRVLGPGGRVLKVFYTTPEEVVTHPILSWIPDAGALFLLYAIVLRGLKSDVHHWIPSGVACALTLANLYLFCLYLPLWLTRFHIFIFRFAYGFARRSAFRAGAVTAVLLGLVGWTLRAEVPYIAHRPSQVTPDLHQELDTAQSAASIQRELLFEIAEYYWPERAFLAGLQRFLSPLFGAASDPEDAQFGLRIHTELSRPTLLAMLGGVINDDDPTDEEGVFKECVQKLHPTITSRAERLIIRDYHQLKRADGYDISIQVLLNVCHSHSTKGRYPKLEGAFWLGIGREAKKRVDPTRKYRREIGESALGAPGVDCNADFSGYLERCPTPYESAEQRLAALEELAQIKWQDLNRLQCTVILQKAVLEWTDEEIADAHKGMTVAKAKNTYQNARKKIREKLAGTCRRPLDFSLPALRERVPERHWPPGFGELP